MPFETYAQAKPFAQAIASAAQSKTMPPWFADPCCGHFSNDPSLTAEQIETLASWAAANAPEGDRSNAPPPVSRTNGWNITEPDTVVQMPQAKQLPASGDVPYQYIIIPTGFQEDRWVSMSEIRQSNRMVVHHAVAYIRDPQSSWLRGAPVGRAFSADDLPTPARSVAPWLCKADTARLRHCSADALHRARTHHRGPDERGASLLEGASGQARSDVAVD